MQLVGVARKFYGTCLAGLGVQQLIYSNFLPVILPVWPSWLPGLSVCAYFFGLLLIGAGTAIVLEKSPRAIGLTIGVLFLAMVLCCHIPHLLFVNPYSNYLGTWTQAFKQFALSGGAFVVAGSYNSEEEQSSP